ncbi:MAG: hypothetical protein U9Q90_02005 [Campylobacterota bacterium]|nr:hypothetical protein [Campylobacterota bacterium]
MQPITQRAGSSNKRYNYAMKKIIATITVLILMTGCTQVVTAPISAAGAVAGAAIDVTGSAVGAAIDVTGSAVKAASDNNQSKGDYYPTN